MERDTIPHTDMLPHVWTCIHGRWCLLVSSSYRVCLRARQFEDPTAMVHACSKMTSSCVLPGYLSWSTIVYSLRCSIFASAGCWRWNCIGGLERQHIDRPRGQHHDIGTVLSSVHAAHLHDMRGGLRLQRSEAVQEIGRRSFQPKLLSRCNSTELDVQGLRGCIVARNYLYILAVSVQDCWAEWWLVWPLDV